MEEAPETIETALIEAASEAAASAAEGALRWVASGAWRDER